MKLRLEINENEQVIAIFYDTWNGEEYEVPDDFEENFTKGIPYKLHNGAILIDNDEKEKRIKEKRIEELKEYLSNTDYVSNKAMDYVIKKKEIPADLEIIIDKRDEAREEINQLEEEL